MRLSKLQREFSAKLVQLKAFILSNGWELTEGDAHRDIRLHGEFGEKKGYGAAYSVHKLRLADDINLWVNDKLVTDGNCDEYKLLGDYWEASHPLARWGGNFKGKSAGDANHFSFEYQGCK